VNKNCSGGALNSPVGAIPCDRPWTQTRSVPALLNVEIGGFYGI